VTFLRFLSCCTRFLEHCTQLERHAATMRALSTVTIATCYQCAVVRTGGQFWEGLSPATRRDSARSGGRSGACVMFTCDELFQALPWTHLPLPWTTTGQHSGHTRRRRAPFQTCINVQFTTCHCLLADLVACITIRKVLRRRCVAVTAALIAA